ncbi:hypothetical protein HaLaN_18475, partial [Haematococcus lacustris]
MRHAGPVRPPVQCFCVQLENATAWKSRSQHLDQSGGVNSLLPALLPAHRGLPSADAPLALVPELHEVLTAIGHTLSCNAFVASSQEQCAGLINYRKH